jgi:Helix-turn-helix.
MRPTAAALQAGEELRKRRQKLNLSIRGFAETAGLPYSLIAGLETGHRRIGETSIRKLIRALNLNRHEADHFLSMFLALSKSRVLARTKEYPPQVINTLAEKLLREAKIHPDQISACMTEPQGSPRADLMLTLKDGRVVLIDFKFRTR